VTTAPSITCPRCGMTSYNPNDIRERYCGNCHAYHDDIAMAQREVEALVRAFPKETAELLRGMGYTVGEP
jgi:protein-arginine kinase activator protein McsA